MQETWLDNNKASSLPLARGQAHGLTRVGLRRMQPYTPATKSSGPRPPEHSKQHAGQPLLSPTCERRTESRSQTHRMAAIRFQCALGSNFAGHGDSAQTDPQSRVVQRGQAAYSQQGRR